MNIDETLNHEYLSEFKGTEPEIELDRKIDTIINDNFKFSIHEYRETLYMHLKD